jgi:hypothetical protein
MPELMRREASAYPGSSSGSVQLSADAGRCPRMTAGRAAQDAEQCADWNRGAQLQPWAQLLPRPAVDADFTAFAAFSTADQDRPAVRVQVAFAQSECSADAQAGAPEHDDQASLADGVGVIAGGVHHRDDLLNCRWVSRVPLALVARRSALVDGG